MSDDFPSELRRFMAQHIESLAQLESLLLYREDPQRQWECAQMAQKLYITADMCAGIINDLERRGFLERAADATHTRYRAPSEEADRLLGELATLYQQRRVAVITHIYSNPVNKVQTFADAFRLRKEG